MSLIYLDQDMPGITANIHLILAIIVDLSRDSFSRFSCISTICLLRSLLRRSNVDTRLSASICFWNVERWEAEIR